MKETIKSVAGIVGLLLLPAAVMLVIGVPLAAISGDFSAEGILACFQSLMLFFGAPCEIAMFLMLVCGMTDKAFGYSCVFWYGGAVLSKCLVPFLPDGMKDVGFVFALAVVGLALWVFHLKTKGE